jgi:phosphoribosylglycinamide formyltransferase-1
LAYLDAQASDYPAPAAPARLVVLVSGSGTNLQALIEACADP